MEPPREHLRVNRMGNASFSSPNNAGECLVMPVRTDEDVVRLRKQVRDDLVALGFSLIDQTKMVTAASELARNTLRYGGGGEAHLVRYRDSHRTGIEVILIDKVRALPMWSWP